MNVSGQSVSKELYRLTGWRADQMWIHYPKIDRRGGSAVHDWSYEKCVPITYRGMHTFLSPAYDLGVLIRKLPERIGMSVETTALIGRSSNNEGWSVIYDDLVQIDKTPEDAVAKLLCILIRKGTIKP